MTVLHPQTMQPVISRIGSAVIEQGSSRKKITQNFTKWAFI